jgi:hypothetical protein
MVVSNEPIGSNNKPAIHLTLNLDAIIAPVQNAVVLSSEIVDFVFAAFDCADLSKKPVNEATRYKFNSPSVSATERRSMYENWLFSKAFQDLMRGLRGSLEQAYFFLELLGGPTKVRSSITLDAFFAPLKKKAATLSFGDLLARVNTKLREPLNFLEAYESLQKARNCFEHRGGVVGEVDAPAGGVMILKFPRVKLFYLRKGEEIEIEVGHVVDAQEGKEQVEIAMRIDVRERRFSKYHRLALSISDFNEIAFACNYFATDLASKISAIGKKSEEESAANASAAKPPAEKSSSLRPNH